VWYLLGQLVRTMIYPGLQVIDIFFKNCILKAWILCMAIMTLIAIALAHLIRYAGRGYNNESAVVTAMTLNSYLWVWFFLSSNKSFVFSVLASIAYFYVVATWSGWVFILDIVGGYEVFLESRTISSIYYILRVLGTATKWNHN